MSKIEPVHVRAVQDAVSELATREFHTGVCLALTAVTGADSGVLWAEIVRAAGDDLIYHAAHIEPDEWEVAGFKKYLWSELRSRKPKKRPAR